MNMNMKIACSIVVDPATSILKTVVAFSYFYHSVLLIVVVHVKFIHEKLWKILLVQGA